MIAGPPFAADPGARDGRARRYAITYAVVCAIVCATVALVSGIAFAQAPAPATGKLEAGKRGFLAVVTVLQSPRCVNCHPAGDRPMQGDQGKPHAQNISRRSVAAGVPCTTCHQQRNSELVGVAGGPPGAPGWGLPPAEQPMVFQGKSPTALCEQLRDPKQTHGKDLAALLDHVTHVPLVRWGWEPGGGRTLPPLDHAAFVAAFTAWVASSGACP